MPLSSYPSGVVGYSVNYDPYGNPLEHFGTGTTNLGFTGEYTDPSDLLYLRARYANLYTATFTSRDPFEGLMQCAMSRNGYSYVEGRSHALQIAAIWICLSYLRG